MRTFSSSKDQTTAWRHLTLALLCALVLTSLSIQPANAQGLFGKSRKGSSSRPPPRTPSPSPPGSPQRDLSPNQRVTSLPPGAVEGFGGPRNPAYRLSPPPQLYGTPQRYSSPPRPTSLPPGAVEGFGGPRNPAFRLSPPPQGGSRLSLSQMAGHQPAPGAGQLRYHGQGPYGSMHHPGGARPNFDELPQYSLRPPPGGWYQHGSSPERHSP